MTTQLSLDKIQLGNCLEILTTLPHKSVDLVFADPPYNLQLQQELWRPNLTQVDAVNDKWDQFENFPHYDLFTKNWLSAVHDVMKDSATIWVSGTYHNIFRVGNIMQDLGFWILNTVTWFKPNAMPNFKGTRLKNDVEFVIWAKKSEKSSYTFNHHLMKQFNDAKQLGSVWTIPVCGGDERLKGTDGKKLHSTQKPIELLKRIVLASSKPGDIVLDPFLGSGTTAAVAKSLRRHWIGIEQENRYVQAAQKRIDGITPISIDDPLIADTLKEKPARVPFKQLLEQGHLKPGQTLYLDKPQSTAIILENGDLKMNGFTGSIHKVGALIKGAPSCNGWKHWYYDNETTGERSQIDILREKMRLSHSNL